MKYPIGIQGFEKIRRDGYVYVDKTQQMWKMVSEGSYCHNKVEKRQRPAVSQSGKYLNL
jgi:hypothetical protein